MTEKESNPKEEKNNRPVQNVFLLGMVSAFLTMPLFIILYKYFPSLEVTLGSTKIRLDHILLFLALFFLTFYLVKKFRMVVYASLLVGLIALTITNFANIYTLENLYHDYAEFLYNLSDNSLREKFEENGGVFRKEKELREAIDYTNPEVRNYATHIAIKHFEEDAYLSKSRKWVQYFSVFKEVFAQWRYVYDPANEDYYSKASQTIAQLNYDEYFKGDCDDYSIMMAACIKAIGGEVRLVRTTVEQKDGNVIGHLYPEVKFGDSKDLESIVYLIKNVFFIEESRGKDIHYYQDSKGFIWLNFDYNDPFPGGRYQSTIRNSEIIV